MTEIDERIKNLERDLEGAKFDLEMEKRKHAIAGEERAPHTLGGITMSEALAGMTDEQLQTLSDECHGVLVGAHTVGATISALGGIDVDLEISRRAMASVIANHTPDGEEGDSTND